MCMWVGQYMVAGYRFLSPSDYIAVARGKASGRHPGSEALQTPHPEGCASYHIYIFTFSTPPITRLYIQNTPFAYTPNRHSRHLPISSGNATTRRKRNAFCWIDGLEPTNPFLPVRWREPTTRSNRWNGRLPATGTSNSSSSRSRS